MKLDKNNIEDILSLTSMQEGMLFHYVMNPDSTEYHEQISIDLVGAVDLDLMQKAWDFVISQNEMLRAIYRWKNINHPLQIILRNHQVKVQYYDLFAAESKSLQDIKQADLSRRIDIEQETLRIVLCKCDETRYTMIISNHHLLYDGWSSGIIIKELISAYHALAQGLEPRTSFKNKFSEYLKWLQSQDKNKQKNYWEHYLAAVEPNDHFFSKVQQGEMQRYECFLGADVKDQLTAFAREHGLTVAALLYSAWGILVQKLNNTHDVMFGRAISGRNYPLKGIENMVGLFINTIPLRVKTDPGETVIQLLKKVNQALKESHEFESTPLVDINKYAGVSSHSPLFNSLVVTRNYPLKISDYQEGLLKVNQYSAFESTNYNLTLGITIQEAIVLNFECNCFADDELMMRIGQYYETIIRTMVANENSKVAAIDILSRAEREQMLYEFNDTSSWYPKEKTLHQLFEEQVARTPENTALVFKEETLTYQVLNQKANQVARVLRAKGVRPDELVAIMVERSPLMIVGILGILKSGGAYLPINPNFPKERIKLMLSDSKSAILLTQSVLRGAASWEGEVIYFDEVNAEEVHNLAMINRSSDLAYVMYTSGSTGSPKGVMTEHRGVINILYELEKKYPLQGAGAYLLKAPYTFDLSVTEIFGGFLSGAPLVILEPESENVPNAMINTIAKTGVTHLNFVTSALNVFLEECRNNDDINEKLSTLKYVLVCGEILKKETVVAFYQLFADKKLVNIHGPTEVTVYDTCYHTVANEKRAFIPIGKPLANYKAYILNIDNQLAPLGVCGELCIANEGLARGYLNQPALTAEKFVNHPFVAGERLYRTGDLARWLADGNLEFLGRMDHQVKIRGFRVELGEIESQILKLDLVKEVVVLAREDLKAGGQDTYLCAYIVSEIEITASNLRQHLLEVLPDYMIPSFAIRLEKLPLTPNGKVDRKVLPAPEGGVEAQYVAPRNHTEAILAQVWSDVLGKERIGINDNFFDLGGHSLKATVVASRVHKELNRFLPLKELFKRPTILALSEYLSATKETPYAQIEPIKEQGHYEASSAQKRMWLLQQFDRASTGYNMSFALTMEGSLDISRLERAFLDLIKRHELLRTTFNVVNDIIVQKVAASMEFEVEYTESTEANIKAAINDFIRPFDLSQAPLLRVELIKTGANKHYLLFDMHHIIADGVSMSIITKELMALYEGQELTKQRIGYKEFSQWQNDYLQSEAMKEQENYWLAQLAGEIPLLNLPLDYPRPTLPSFAGGSLEFRLNAQLTKGLNNLARTTDTTLYMVLLSAVNILLFKYTNQEDIIVGTPIAGRRHVDLENVIGMFVNTLAMRCYPKNSKTYGEFLSEVKETALAAYENQDYQFEELIGKLNLHRDLSRTPLFDVMFVLQNIEVSELEVAGLKLTRANIMEKTAKFDLTFTAVEVSDEIVFTIEYGASLFKRETIQRLSIHLQNLMNEIVADQALLLGDINILSSAEREQIIHEFNDPDAEYPRDKTIHQLFEEQVARTPERVALVFEQKQLTYGELNQKANVIAHKLRSLGVKPGDYVGIIAARSLEMVIGIYGIIKSGGAYVPIDPTYPQARINFMLEDCQAKVVLIKGEISLKEVTEEVAVPVIDLGEIEVWEGESGNPSYVNQGTDLLYLIYTSGTTGKPKGVMIQHQNVVSLLKSDKFQFDFNEADVWSLFHSYAFDFSVWEMFGATLNGGKLIIVPLAVCQDPPLFLDYLKRYQISVLNQVPTAFYQLMLAENETRMMASIRYLIFGGEALNPRKLASWRRKYQQAKIINMYGITEITVHATYREITEVEIERGISDIGKPIPTLQIYILNNGKLCGIGIPGELYIAGAGVAAGYLNQPELTRSKFIENPFTSGTVMYRTGDLARRLPDGNMEFLGRMDHQVKIRGFRIELRAIENHLLKLDQIKAVWVMDREDGQGHNYLCAYFVATAAIAVNEIRQHLSEMLPDYMIPSYFVRLEELPLTANGKIDQPSLPEPVAMSEEEYVAPRTEMEVRVAQIWSEVLEKERIGINDNFFELGGHSLRATVLIEKINQRFNLSEPVVMLFKYPTINAMVTYLNQDHAQEDDVKEVNEREIFVQSRRDQQKRRQQRMQR